jgi:hypothetical protein
MTSITGATTGSCVANCGGSAAPGWPFCRACLPYVAPEYRRRLGAATTEAEYDAAVDQALVSYRHGKRRPAVRGLPSRVKYRRRLVDGVRVRRAVKLR